ncbi:MAG: hypothetical protein IJP68_08020 [Selenomonadaceae bacterium]|nr:hypothetical protein [Selenomonadaceae bacterium]
MCMVRIFNQLGDEVGRFSNDRDENFYAQFGYSSCIYPPGSWGCTTSHYRGFYALLAIVQGNWTSLGVYATEDEAKEVWHELADTVQRYQGVAAPAVLPEYHVPRGKKPVDAYAVFKALDNR